jgi:transposase
VNDEVMIAVDHHKASNTLAVLDPVTKIRVDGARFANSPEGYEELMAFAGRWQRRRWAVEGCHGAGHSLAQRLVAGGELVLDVPAKLAARVRVFSQGHGRKTDKDNAVSVGLAALDGQGIAEVAPDGATVSLRLLCDRREELVVLRTQAVGRLHRLLAELTPGGMRRELSAAKAEAVLTRLRPADEVGCIRAQLAADHLQDIKALDVRLKATSAQIAKLVQASQTGPSPRSEILEPPTASTTSASGVRARHPKRRCAASNAASPTWSTTSSSLIGSAQRRADHLRPQRQCRLHPPHQRPAHARPHHHPGQHPVHSPGVRRPRLERRPSPAAVRAVADDRAFSRGMATPRRRSSISSWCPVCSASGPRCARRCAGTRTAL